MFNIRKRKYDNNNHPINFFKKTDLFSELLEAVTYLNPSANEEQVFYMATTALLAITDINKLSKAVELATNEANNKAKEVSLLNDMFNAPTTDNNNN